MLQVLADANGFTVAVFRAFVYRCSWIYDRKVIRTRVADYRSLAIELESRVFYACDREVKFDVHARNWPELTILTSNRIVLLLLPLTGSQSTQPQAHNPDNPSPTLNTKLYETLI